MDKAINGWTVLLILILVAMGYGFAVWQTKTMIPQAAAQIAGNEKLVGEVNKSYQELIKQVNTAFTDMTKRVEALEKK